MRDLAVLFLHLLATVARLAGPGGAHSVVAEFRARQAAGADPQSLPETVTQPSALGIAWSPVCAHSSCVLAG